MAGPRIRTLKPEILDDEKVAPLSDSAFRLFTALVILADDYGNARADVRWLQGQVWWAHGAPPNVLSALIELWKATLIEVYGVRGGTYLHLKGWEKHQRIDNAGKNRVPKPNDTDSNGITVEDEVVAAIRGDSRTIAAGSGSGSGSRPGPGRDPDREVAARPLTKAERKHRLPADWLPKQPERKTACAATLDCDAEAAHFRDHHNAKGEPMLDWDAAFRTWLRNAVKFGRRGAQGKTPLEQQLDRVARLEAEELTQRDPP